MTAIYVYTITDAAGDLLYVGHTQNLFTRLKQHRQSHWGHRAAHARAEVFSRKDDALEWERHLIADLEPEFNIQGNPRHMSFERYLLWAGVCDHDELEAYLARHDGAAA